MDGVFLCPRHCFCLCGKIVFLFLWSGCFTTTSCGLYAAYATDVSDSTLAGWGFILECTGGITLVLFAVSLGISILYLNNPERPTPTRSEQNGVTNDGYSDISHTYMDIQPVTSHGDNVSPEHQIQRAYTDANNSVLPSGVSKMQPISQTGYHGNQTPLGRAIHRLYLNDSASVLPSGISRKKNSSQPLSGYRPHVFYGPPEAGAHYLEQNLEQPLGDVDSVLSTDLYQTPSDVLDCPPPQNDVTVHSQDGEQGGAPCGGAS